MGRDAAPVASHPDPRQADDNDVPVRADGVQLIGELPGSGYREPPSLARRSDGQTIQLTRLLYLVLEAVDGRKTYAEIADVVSPAFGRLVSAENVRNLCDSRLRTLGLLRRADGSEPNVRRANPLLTLRLRYVVSDPAATRRLTAPFARLFNPLVVAVVTLAFVAVCAWVLLEKGLASATHQAFHEPGLLLLVFGLTLVSAGFHEFGHAAAARYGGAIPGAMGTGLYLVWPAFYTDVTDSYRLGRAGRIRTDLGGLYFNAIVAVAMFGAYVISGWDAILLIIATQVLQMVRQLAPFVRFDGYHVLADVTGVPDLYHRIGPTLKALLPGHWNDPAAKVLKPWARAVVTTWVVVVVPLLVACLVLMVMTLPRLLGTALAGAERQWQLMGEQLTDGYLLAVMVRVLSIVAIAIPVLGVGYILARVVLQVVRGTWRATSGRPGRRAVAGVLAAAILAGLAWAWWPQPGTYRPVQAYERGTLADALPALGPTPHGLQEGRAGSASTVWPAGAELPTAETPELALVLVPRDGAASAVGDSGVAGVDDGTAHSGDVGTTWVFPFSRPAAPEAGDNQAFAVNTEDGSTVYDVAFALVWADDDRVLNTNEAYAFASCTGCQTVAVAFQVLLVVGEASVIVPQNLAGALNYGCLDCLTYALATQLVLTLQAPLSDQAVAELVALWQEIAEFGSTIQDVPLADLQRSLTVYETRILDIIRSDSTAAPVPDQSSSPEPQLPSDSDPTRDPTPDPGTSQAPTAGGPDSQDSSNELVTTPTPTPSTSTTSTATGTASPTSTATSP